MFVYALLEGVKRLLLYYYASFSVDRWVPLRIENFDNKKYFCFVFCQDYASSAMCSAKHDALPVEVVSRTDADEKLSHMRPVVVLKTLNLAQ